MSNSEPQIQLPLAPEVSYQNAIVVARDCEHLKILMICWYVAAGLSLLFGFFPIIHVTLGLMMLLKPGAFGPDPILPFMGWIFFIMGMVFIVFMWTGAVLAFLAASSLKQRRRLTLCYVAAAVACLQLPFGTALGICTFIVLGRPSVKAGFV